MTDFWSGITGGLAHTGNMGLPDFGLTELIGGNKTAQGGSNLFGGSPAVEYKPEVLSAAPPPAAPAPAPTRSGTSNGSNMQNGGWYNGKLWWNGNFYDNWDQANASTQQKSQQQSQPSQPSYEDQVRNSINSGYDNYFGYLDKIMAGLDPQRQAQEQIIANNFDQGINDLTFQKNQGLSDLATQKRKTEEQTVKTLKDLTGNLVNSMNAGQVYLGARGAGDSSAANQYSYALTKEGNKNRGNVLSQQQSNFNDIADRESRLNNVFMQESGRLKTEKANSIQSVAQWFAEAQNQVRQMVASGQLSKGQDLANLSNQLLQNAMNKLSAIEQQARNNEQSLKEWAMNNAKDISTLKSNLAAVSNYSAPSIQGQPLLGQATVDSTGNYRVPAGFGFASDNSRTDIFGRKIA